MQHRCKRNFFEHNRCEVEEEPASILDMSGDFTGNNVVKIKAQEYLASHDLA